MSLTSYGYDGSLDEGAARVLLDAIGARYIVVTGFDVVAEAVGALSVRVNPGTAYGDGVVDVLTPAQTGLAAGAIASGTRWDTVVIARNRAGTGGVTTLAIRAGTSAQAVSANVNTVANTFDQPLALIKLVAGQSNVQQVIDLRHFARKLLVVKTKDALFNDGIPGAVNDAARGFAYAEDTGHFWHLVGGTEGSQTWVDLQAPTWLNIPIAGGLTGAPQPQYAIINGAVRLRGAWQRSTGAKFDPSGGVIAGRWSLGTMPVGARPSIAMLFAVGRGLETTASGAFIQIDPDGTIQGMVGPAVLTSTGAATSVDGSTIRIRADGVTYPAEL